MVKRAIGQFIEWALSYERTVYFTGFRSGNVGRHDNVPYSKHKDDAGYDLFVDRGLEVAPGGVAEVNTGICLAAKARVWFEIKARSSTFKRLGLEVQDAVIDHGYRGEMFAIVHNPTDRTVTIPKNVRICQIVPHMLMPCRFIPADKLPRSARGRKGFGSSGW